MSIGARKILTITVPAALITLVAIAAGLEAWARWSWDSRKGTPGFFESDATRRQRLASNYTGWFAGVPVHINSLGFRDDREYSLDKGPNTFRIIVLGDSVTFGHGSIAANTYPALLERKLKAWRPEVDWQVWNLAVPGYNTSQELAHLLQVGPRYQPDLVVVGFFGNDLVDAYDVEPAGWLETEIANVKSVLRRHMYSLELYRRIYLTALWKLAQDDEYHKRIEHLGVEDELVANVGRVNDLKEQQLTPIDRYTDDEVRAFTCTGAQKPDPDAVQAMQRESVYAAWLRSVRRLQELNRTGAYRIVFFLNLTPLVCPDGDGDRFDVAGSAAINDFFVTIFSEGAPTVSTYDELLHRRPTQMPNACCHAIGNTNLVKAEVLFDFLRGRLPQGRPAQ
jgi:hypothetical protein